MTKPEFTELIRNAGGTVLSRLPKIETIDEEEVSIPYHAKKDSTLARCSHYVVSDSKTQLLTVVHPRLCHTTAPWLMNCIAKHELQDQVEPPSQ